MTEKTDKKSKKKVEVKVAGPNYQEKDPMQAIMEQLDEYEEGTPKRTMKEAVGCPHEHN